MSKPHIKTGGPYQDPKPKPSLTWYPGASLVEIHVPREHPQMPEKKRKPRGRITEMSADSRRRLKLFMGTLKREELGRALVVTLTYPNDFPAPDDHEVYKGHLNKFGIYLVRRWPKCSAVWKLEFQTRGAAHYHLMLFGVRDELSKVREWMTKTWGRIAHKGDIHEGRWGTKVEKIRSVGGAAAYMVKYLGKGDQTMPGNFSGRYWGKVHEVGLPVVNSETVELEEKKALQIRRIARKKMQKDVEHSRWKRFLDKEKESWRFGSRLFWETLKSARHGSKRRLDEDGWLKPQFLEWSFKDESLIEVDGIKYKPTCPWQRQPFPLDMLRKDVRILPKKWKARNNDSMNVICDARAFVEALSRLEKPASSFREFSRRKV